MSEPVACKIGWVVCPVAVFRFLRFCLELCKPPHCYLLRILESVVHSLVAEPMHDWEVGMVTVCADAGGLDFEIDIFSERHTVQSTLVVHRRVREIYNNVLMLAGIEIVYDLSATLILRDHE